MRISACYITKNVENVIEKSLKSLKESVDEIVIVDTGSIDKTKKIAKKMGAKIFDYVWENDFASARNFALEKTCGDWIIFLDADEYFSEETSANLRQAIESNGENANLLLVELVNIDIDKQNAIIDRFFCPRIFRAGQGISYYGAIHEQLMQDGMEIEAIKILPAKELQIYHTGYSSSQIIDKSKRNLNLLLKEVECTKMPENLYMYLAEAYDGIGDEENAMHYAHLDIKNGRRNMTYASRSYRILLRNLSQKENVNSLAMLTILEKSVTDFPELPEFHAEYAQYLMRNLDYEKAKEEMQKAIVCYENYISLEPTIFDQRSLELVFSLLKQWEQEEAFQKNLKISACVITKNEENEIPMWIDNMKKCSNEQILVDTGSTDNTVKLAQAAGVKVFEYEWNDNFAEAKNYAIEKASGDWIIFLDADETFTPETIMNVRKIVAKYHSRIAEIDAIMCPIINIDTDQNNIEISRFVNLRIFRNQAYLRYTGSVHEGIRHQGEELRIHIENENLSIYHTGYSSNRIKRKLERNLALLQQDIAKKGEGIQHYRYLVDCYQGMGDYEKVIKYAKLHLASNAASIGTESDIYRNLLNAMIFLKKNPAEMKPYFEEAIKRFSDIPDFYAYYAADFFRQKDYPTAKKYLLKALEVYSTEGKKSVTSSSFGYIISEAYSYLGEIFFMEKNTVESAKYVNLALKDNPYNCQAFRQFMRSVEAKSLSEKVEHLKKYYKETEKDMVFILGQLEDIDLGALYLYYAKSLKELTGEVSGKMQFYSLIKQKNYDQIYQSAIQKTTEKMRLLAYSLLCLEKNFDKKESLALLPTEFCDCIARYYGRRSSLGANGSAGYMILVKMVLRFADPAIIKNFTAMGYELEAAQMEQLFQIYYEEKFWTEAIELFERVLLNNGIVDKSMFHLAGICFYHCGDFIKAEKYFALSDVISLKKEKEFYLSLIRKIK